jgi:hypothetical protein
VRRCVASGVMYLRLVCLVAIINRHLAHALVLPLCNFGEYCLGSS